MEHYRLTLVSVLAFATSCLSQDTVSSIGEVLIKSNLSGSLAYTSTEPCRSSIYRYPSPPKPRSVKYSGSAVNTLREMFADDPKMRVTQEPAGIIRMAETDVPLDFLDLKVHRVVFDVSNHGPVVFGGGPNVEMWKILSTPEVQAFKSAHNIGPHGFRVPGDAMYYAVHVPGELNDVTVSRALDYVLRTFPGYWIYGNCTNEEGAREAFFWFYKTAPIN